VTQCVAADTAPLQPIGPSFLVGPPDRTVGRPARQMNDDFTPEETRHIAAMRQRLAILESRTHSSSSHREARALRWVIRDVLGVEVPPPPEAPQIYVRPRAA